MRHFDVQLVGGWAMLSGMLAEMETGEGKTFTATLAAATAALAGRAVHVITVNDYLAEARRRDDAAGVRGARPERGLRAATDRTRRSAAGTTAATSPIAATREMPSTTCATAWCWVASRGSSP